MKQVIFVKFDNGFVLPVELKIRRHTGVQTIINSITKQYQDKYDFAAERNKIAIVLPESFYTANEEIPENELKSTVNSCALLLKGYAAIEKRAL